MDAFGQQLRTFLSLQGVDLTLVKDTADIHTGTAIITVADADNTIVVVPGANALVSAEDIATPMLAKGDVAVSQFEIPQATIAAFFKRARAAGATTILNPAPAMECDAGLLDLVDILILNETELGLLAKAELHESDDPRCFVGDVEATEVAEGLKVRGKLDLDTEFGASAYRQVKSRRVGALSIGCEVIVATKSSDGTNMLRELSVVEVNLVSRPANPAALVTNVKAQGKPTAPIRDQLARDAFVRYEKEGPADMMTNVKLDILVKDRQSQLDAVQQIIDTADALQADLTADQAKSVEEHTKSVKDLDEKIRQARHDLFVSNA